MALRFSDIFGSGDKEGKSDTSTAQDADANFSASNSGVTAASESYSRDEDGNEDYDRTSVDSGELSLSSDVAAGNMFEDVSGLSNSPTSATRPATVKAATTLVRIAARAPRARTATGAPTPIATPRRISAPTRTPTAAMTA